MPMLGRALAIGGLLLVSATAFAQGDERAHGATPAMGERRPEPLLEQARRLTAAPPGRSVGPGFVWTPLVDARAVRQRSGEQVQSQPRRRSPRQRIFGAIVGATGGFFAGGYTGAWIEGDRCRCDDPGLKGALIGAPVGAVAGGVLGGLFLF